jgi:hypothetical protein
MLFKSADLVPKHTGVLFCLLILVLLLVLNFNKCYTSIFSIFQSRDEPFQDASIGAPTLPIIDVSQASITTSIPTVSSPVSSGTNIETVGELTVEIKPEEGKVKVTFDDVQPNSQQNSQRSGYLLVLAKYDKNLNEVDALNVKVSNETQTTTPTTVGPTRPASRLSKICNTENICSYTFANLDAKDEQGDLFYYKLGVGVIYNSGNTERISDILPYRFGIGNRQQYFRIDINQQEQEKLVRRLDEIERQSIFKPKEASGEQALVTSKDGVSSQQPDMDSYMRMLRPFIGNYPDEFTLDKNKIKELTLQGYLNESLALGQLNVNVDVADLIKPTSYR